MPNFESNKGTEREIGKKAKLMALANQLIWSRLKLNSVDTGTGVSVQLLHSVPITHYPSR